VGCSLLTVVDVWRSDAVKSFFCGVNLGDVLGVVLGIVLGVVLNVVLGVNLGVVLGVNLGVVSDVIRGVEQLLFKPENVLLEEA
jgi:hypothetical protein